MWFEIARRQSALPITQTCVSTVDGQIDIVDRFLKDVEPVRLNWTIVCSVTHATESYRVQTRLSSQWACCAQVSPLVSFQPSLTLQTPRTQLSHQAIDCRTGTYPKYVVKSNPIQIAAGSMTKPMESGGPQPSHHGCFRGLLQHYSTVSEPCVLYVSTTTLV